MTDKRFTLKSSSEHVISANLFDNGTYIGSICIGDELILELLNDLSEENEQLKCKIELLQNSLDMQNDKKVKLE